MISSGDLEERRDGRFQIGRNLAIDGHEIPFALHRDPLHLFEAGTVHAQPFPCRIVVICLNPRTWETRGPSVLWSGAGFRLPAPASCASPRPKSRRGVSGGPHSP